jgi:hypothetical protein
MRMGGLAMISQTPTGGRSNWLTFAAVPKPATKPGRDFAENRRDSRTSVGVEIVGA